MLILQDMCANNYYFMDYDQIIEQIIFEFHTNVIFDKNLKIATQLIFILFVISFQFLIYN